MIKTDTKLSQKTINKACSRHNWALQWCWNYERMQAAGYAYAMVPVIKELYDTDEERCRQLERHMQFYNTHPGTSALIMGADVALEEARQGEIGDNLKVALMGPLASVGDTIEGVLVLPTFAILAASMAAEGNMLALLISVVPIFLLWLARWPMFKYGYKQGVNVISDLSNMNKLDKLQVMASILGITVVGGFVPSILNKLVVKKEFLAQELVNEMGEVVSTTGGNIQAGLDAILPYMIPIALTGLCYWLIKHKKVTPLKTILLIAVIAFICGFFGVM